MFVPENAVLVFFQYNIDLQSLLIDAFLVIILHYNLFLVLLLITLFLVLVLIIEIC